MTLYAQYMHNRRKGMNSTNALIRARNAVSDSSKTSYYCGLRYYIVTSRGTWSNDREAYYCMNGEAPFRNEIGASPLRNGTISYSSDDSGFDQCIPRIAYISNRGYIAGIEWSERDGQKWNPNDYYSEKRDAEIAAHRMAERQASIEYEYNTGYQSGNMAREDWYNAMSAARKQISRARAMYRAGGSSVLSIAHDMAREALETRADAWQKFRDAMPARRASHDHWADGWRDGAHI